MRPLFVRPSRPREFLLDEEEEGRNPIAHCKDNIFLSLFLSLSVCNNQTKKRERERDPSSLPPFCFFEVGSFLVRVCVCAKRARVLYKELFCVKRRDNCSTKNGGKRFGATLKKHAFFLFFFFLLLFDSLQNFLTSKKTTTTTAADSDDDDDDDESDDDDDRRLIVRLSFTETPFLVVAVALEFPISRRGVVLFQRKRRRRKRVLC